MVKQSTFRQLALGFAFAIPAVLSAQATKAPAAKAPAAKAPASSAQAQSCPATKGGSLPIKYDAKPTVAAITPCDLMTRLYIYADDSMMGRRVGTSDNIRATAYLEKEVRKMGLKPAGDSGGFFQYVGLFTSRAFDTTSTFTVDGRVFKGGTDFNANILTAKKTLNNVAVVFGGVAGDTMNLLTPAAVRGKILILLPGTPGAGGLPGRGRAGGVPASAAAQALAKVNASAAMVFTITGDALTPAGPGRGGFIEFRSDTMPGTGAATNALAFALFGKPLAEVAKGTEGKSASLAIKFNEVQNPARNVVALLPGSDPRLKNEYVLISAHNDHIGYGCAARGGECANNVRPTTDSDSLHIWNSYFVKQGADGGRGGQRTPEMLAAFKISLDSVRKLRPTARPDSIANGADDDGSGSVTVLEIAQKFATAAVKPKRSILFVWQTGEESGMYGSYWYAAHPTVNRDNIVADINMDMVGRGAASDATGSVVKPDSLTGRLVANGELMHGGKGYLQLVGSRRLSKEFGDLVETVNKEKKLGFNFDYQIDANGHPQTIYCRSDHWAYAKYGIPVVFMTTGGHADYHQLSDEPQYIDYKHMAEVGTLSFEVATRVANMDHRPKVDLAGPFDPTVRCVQ